VAVGRVLGEERHRARRLAADREALRDAQRDQQDRGGDADGRVGGQEADARGGHADQADDEHEEALAADPVAEDPADDRAERSDEERDGVTGEHERDRVARAGHAEEDDGQRGGHEGEDAVVVQLDEDADAARGHDLGDVRAFGDRCVGNVRGGRVGRGHADSWSSVADGVVDVRCGWPAYL
jgi:hypothetical protein